MVMFYLPEKTKKRRQRDKGLFESLDPDACQICGAHGADKRSLFVDCLLELSEAIPEALDIREVGIDSHKSGYYLRICKSCRASFIRHMQAWRSERVTLRTCVLDHDGCEIEEE